jgi:hypothetical protein
MREYYTTGIIKVNGGYIGLDKRQAAARAHRLRAVKNMSGRFEVLQSVTLKAGETVWLENPGKVLLKNLELTEVEQARQTEAEKQARDQAEKEQARALAEAEWHGAIITAARQAAKAGQVTKSGVPLVDAMEAVAGFSISTEDRDKAWEEIQTEMAAENDKG